MSQTPDRPPGDLDPTGVPPTLESTLACDRSAPARGSSVANASPRFVPPATLGRYRIGAPLGRGGMGAVFEARDERTGRTAAVKFPDREALEDGIGRSRFFRETRLVAALDHPGVCQLLDAGEIDGIPYLAMPLLEGRPLSEILKAERLSERDAIALTLRMAQALAHAHARGVIHRDVKPSNVIVASDGRPILLDFGLARRIAGLDESFTGSGAILGTPGYLSPEQAEGRSRAVGPAADIYGLGVVAYELLTGRRPFEGSPAEVIGKHLYQSPPPPESVRADIDPQLSALILQMLAKSPEDRPATMEDVARRLAERLEFHEPTAASAESSDRFSWMLPASLFLGALVAFFGAWLFASRIRDDADVAIAVVCTGSLLSIGIVLAGASTCMAVRRVRSRRPRKPS